MRPNTMIAIFVLVMMTAGIYSKVFLVTASLSREKTGEQFYREVVTPSLQQAKFIPIESRKITHDGNFTVRLWLKPDCNALLLVLPMPRNAETATLLQSAFPGLLIWQQYLYKDAVYSRYPAFRFWLDTALDHLRRMTGLAEHTDPGAVPLSIAATSDCVKPGNTGLLSSAGI